MFLVLAVAGTLTVDLLYQAQIASRLKLYVRESLEIASLSKQTIRNALQAVTVSALYLAEQNELLEYLETGDPAWLDAVAQEYAVLAKRGGAYDLDPVPW